MNVDKAMKIIDQIASKLGVAAEYIIPELARMQIAKLIIAIVASIIALAVVCVAIRKIIKYIRSLNEDDDSWSGDQDTIRFSLMLFSRLYRLCWAVRRDCTLWRNQRIEWVARVTNSAVHRVCDESIRISVSSRTMEE